MKEKRLLSRGEHLSFYLLNIETHTSLDSAAWTLPDHGRNPSLLSHQNQHDLKLLPVTSADDKHLEETCSSCGKNEKG